MSLAGSELQSSLWIIHLAALSMNNTDLVYHINFVFDLTVEVENEVEKVKR